MSMSVKFGELFPYSDPAAAAHLCTYYFVAVLYTLALAAVGVPLTAYSGSSDTWLHAVICSTLGVVGTACVAWCSFLSGCLLASRGEWWNLWKRQAGEFGVRFVVLTSAVPQGFGMLDLYCLWKHGRHMAEGEAWHGAALSYALIVPRIVQTFLLTLLAIQVFPVTRQWANKLSLTQRKVAMDLLWWGLLAVGHNLVLAALHGSHAHYMGLEELEYPLLVYHCLLLIWVLVLVVHIAASVADQEAGRQQGTPVVPSTPHELVPGTDIVVDIDAHPPPMTSLVSGVILLWGSARRHVIEDEEEEEEEGREMGGGGGRNQEDSYLGDIPPHVADRVRRHSNSWSHRYLRHNYQELV